MKLILHIGTHKTGSSAIQNTLAQNYDTLLQKDILYPKAATIWNKHDILGWFCDQTLLYSSLKKNLIKTEEEYFGDVRKEIEATEPQILVLSGEDFSLLDDPKQLIDKLIFHKIQFKQLEIVVYLRRQDLFLNSLYKEFVKGSYSQMQQSFEEFVHDPMIIEHATYSKFLKKWQNITDDTQLTVHIYDKKYFSNVINDFSAIIKINPSDLTITDRLDNPSVSSAIIPFLRVLNQSPTEKETRDKINTYILNSDINKKIILLLAYQLI